MVYRRLALSALILAAISFSPAPALAEGFHYIDESGNMHFVDDITKVPPQYRGQIFKPTPTPKLSDKDIARLQREADRDQKKKKREKDKEEKKKKKEKEKEEKKKGKKHHKGSAGPGGGDSSEKADGVELYISSACPDCKELEKLLRDKRIPFEKYDVEKSERGSKLYQQVGGGDIPLLKRGTKVLKGYNKAAVRAFLGIDERETGDKDKGEESLTKKR